jgi:hypothetical protein
MRSSTVNDPSDLERYARLKVDIPAVLAAKNPFPRIEAWTREYLLLTAKTQQNCSLIVISFAVESGNTSNLERWQGLLFGSASPQALARFEQQTLFGAAVFAANPVLLERAGNASLI